MSKQSSLSWVVPERSSTSRHSIFLKSNCSNLNLEILIYFVQCWFGEASEPSRLAYNCIFGLGWCKSRPTILVRFTRIYTTIVEYFQGTKQYRFFYFALYYSLFSFFLLCMFFCCRNYVCKIKDCVWVICFGWQLFRSDPLRFLQLFYFIVLSIGNFCNLILTTSTIIDHKHVYDYVSSGLHCLFSCRM